MAREAALFIFYDSKTRKVLSEKRSPHATRYPNEIIFPSGLVEENEKGHPERTMLREVGEELGVTVLEYVLLSPHTPIHDTDETTTRLYPFVITKWKGEIPDAVLDKGNPLLWQTLEEVVHGRGPVSRTLFVELLQKYLRESAL